MFFRKSACEKFKNLVLNDEVVSVSPKAKAFTIEHSLRCESCREYEKGLIESMSALRKGAFNYSGSENFTENVLRELRRESQFQRVYGTQLALVGVVTGVVIFLALLQLLTIQPKIHQGDPTGTAQVDGFASPLTIFETPSDAPKTPLSNEG